MKLFKFISATALSTIFFLSSSFAQNNTSAKLATQQEPSFVSWNKETIDLGTIPQGKPVTVEYVLTNKSKEPILISDVATSCGCTVPEYTKKPIEAKASTVIKATYNAANAGTFDKIITVSLSNNEKKPLHLKGTVVKS
jgi:hypothetical protein